MSPATPQPLTFVFKDDGSFPNSKLPLLVYRGAFDPSQQELAHLMVVHLASNGWTNSWRNGVYDYAHYHSTSHEALAVFDGCAKMQLGGPATGTDVEVVAGDVIIIPAGVAHRQIESSGNFGVVGAYPQGRKWDVLRGLAGERPAADTRIEELPIPDTDPLLGRGGPLTLLWSSVNCETRQKSGNQDCDQHGRS